MSDPFHCLKWNFCWVELNIFDENLVISWFYVKNCINMTHEFFLRWLPTPYEIHPHWPLARNAPVYTMDRSRCPGGVHDGLPLVIMKTCRPPTVIHVHALPAGIDRYAAAWNIVCQRWDVSSSQATGNHSWLSVACRRSCNYLQAIDGNTSTLLCIFTQSGSKKKAAVLRVVTYGPI